MLNQKLLLFLTIVLLLTGSKQAFSQTTTPKSFSFYLQNDANTSAGIYKSDGTLIRTLWNNKRYSAGNYTQAWDGRDDEGAVATDKDYIVKILSNNVKYRWEGVIGNTSYNFTGSDILRSYIFCKSMVIVDTTMYSAIGYTEAYQSPFIKLSTNGIQKLYPVNVPRGQSETVDQITTDGTNIYCAARDPYAPSNMNKALSFVYSFRLSDESLVTFKEGVAVDQYVGKDYTSTVSKMELPGNTQSVIDKALITGIAVQKKGNYLFVARKNIDQLQVIDKNTGSVIQILNITAPGKLQIDSDDNLWMISNKTVAKYLINSNGTLSKNLSVSNLIDPIDIAVSPDNSTMLVADGASSCQLKAYDNSTGALLFMYGKAGGYSTDASVENNKFFFSDVNGSTEAFLAFQPDGTLWVGEPRNHRIQHFSANGRYLDRIMFVGQLYSQFVNSSDPTRVTAKHLEFKIDYSKTLDNGTNGSWKLVKNWGYNIPSGYDDLFENLRCITTLSNGRTYALMSIKNTQWEVIELDKNIRYTGIKINSMSHLYPDGSLRTVTPFIAGQQTIFTRQDLTGFDGNDNPIWSSPYIIARSPVATDQDPLYSGISHTSLTPGEITTSGKIITFEGVKTAKSVYGSSGYHLGAIKTGEDKWIWRTSKSTPDNYTGEFPTDGAFDVGNGVKYPGGSAKVFGNNIIWNYHGEFWKNSQTNMFNHFYENGLMVGQFGVLGPNVSRNSDAMMAGNVFYPNIVKDPNDSDIAYLYHGDEGIHAGIHRWKITGLNTIKEQEAVLQDNVASDSTGGIDLMQGLTHQSILVDGAHGWNRNSPVEDVATNIFTRFWSVRTGYKTYDNGKSPDVFIEYNQGGNNNYTVTRDLGTNTNVKSWKLSGNVSWLGTQENQTNSTGGNYIDILDNTGKILARIYRRIDFLPGKVVRYFLVNNQILAADSDWSLFNKTKALQPIEITAGDKGTLTFQYADYPPVTTTTFDSTANWQAPQTLRFTFYKTNGLSNLFYRAIDVSDMHFAITADINTGIAAPTIIANDSANTLIASHPMSNSEIVVSENNGPFLPYAGPIQVGNVNRPVGYWKFKIKATGNRKEGAVSLSPAYTYTNVTPDAPMVVSDDTSKTVSASHILGASEILVSVNNGPFRQYTGPIDEGNVARPAGYWKFKVKAAVGRNESDEASSEAFTFTPEAPSITADDETNIITISSALGDSQILTSFNDGPFVGGYTKIFVGDYTRPAGYYKFKVRSGPQRSESDITYSPEFTTTPRPPIVTSDDTDNSLSASHPLGTSEILVSFNNGMYQPYTGTIDVGNVDRPAGYWKFKIKAANGRSESVEAYSPAFNFVSTPNAPTIIADDIANTIIASSPLGNSEILVSINDGPYIWGFTNLYVGNYDRPAGYYKFKIKSARFRNESNIVNSPAFTTKPQAPTVTSDDTGNSLTASHPLGTSEILVSVNNGVYQQYTGPINVGNVARPAAYWKFKIKAANGRSESDEAYSPPFNFVSTPDAPTIIADDIANTIIASSPLGNSEILVSINDGPYIWGFTNLYVGNYNRPPGYYKFKIKSGTLRNESNITYSPAFTANTGKNSRIMVNTNSDSTNTGRRTLSSDSLKNTTAGVIKLDTVRTTKDENLRQNITVFPNPVTGNNFTIRLIDFADGEYSMRLINMYGNTIINKKINHSGRTSSQTINLQSSLSPGVYIIEVKGNGTFITSRIIKN